MVGVVVGKHDAVQSGHARGAQEGRHDAVARISVPAEVRPRIVEQRVMPRLRDYRESLSDIEHREP